MKSKPLTIGFSIVLISILVCSLAYASESTIGTGYAVTSTVTETPEGTPVTITASTLNQKVTQITFTWLGPPNGNGEALWQETVPVVKSGTYEQWNDGTTAEVLYATSTYTPDTHGEWSVEVTFHNSAGGLVAKYQSIIELLESMDININGAYPFFTVNRIDIEGTDSHSLFVIPEIPLGTIGATVAMAAALALFITKKKRQQR